MDKWSTHLSFRLSMTSRNENKKTWTAKNVRVKVAWVKSSLKFLDFYAIYIFNLELYAEKRKE